MQNESSKRQYDFIIIHANNFDEAKVIGYKTIIVNWGWDRKFYFVQFCKKGERFVWEFPLDKFDEACEFADIKRKEIFGSFAGNH